MDCPQHGSSILSLLALVHAGGVSVGSTMATISISGEYRARGWSAITGLLKAFSTKIPQLPTERESSQHSRWISEPKRGRQKQREGDSQGLKKGKKINVIIGDKVV